MLVLTDFGVGIFKEEDNCLFLEIFMVSDKWNYKRKNIYQKIAMKIEEEKQKSSHEKRSITIPFPKKEYNEIVNDATKFRN